MKIISIDKDNIDTEHICCAIGNDLKNKARSESKKQWIRIVSRMVLFSKD
ncbi:hypothetical protein LEP1GSC195_2245 [Leptospira wolbachii serovar Codice str. CDC]|uniref:Uncharacterized protein n=1 Tax=Leptospira wolbachii serovar Codice str. CDC TaxID=1218599 RepID=R9A1M1_9LEPT|nr:hypothetical protein [Leptospira wolbachii]EOQ95874.1 hypothetical protein LEP1GSC195_2245 [Leptospira wolbachii serovar Codice str. CDC]